jgi:N-acyl-L-homoserine lactone synthetase
MLTVIVISDIMKRVTHVKTPGRVEGNIAPVFGSLLFRKNNDSRFATVGLGFGMFPEGVDSDIFTNYLRLRKNVYVDQTGMLPRDGDYPDGMEFDEDDERSSAVVILENRGMGQAAVIACMRAIYRDKGGPLCIEESLGFSAPKGSSEASRYILVEEQGERKLSFRDRMMVNQKLFDAMVAIFNHKKLSPVYGLVELPVERALSRSGAPPTRLDTSGNIFVDKFGGTEHVGVIIDIPEMSRAMTQRLGGGALQQALLEPGQVQFWGNIRHGAAAL